MFDELVLLAAIEADPLEDAPRLVYADWLLERGDARGELIQLQCALAAREDAVMGARVEALIAAHAAAWLAGLPACATAPHFHRGFLDSIDLGTLAALCDNAPALRRLRPRPTFRVEEGRAARLDHAARRCVVRFDWQTSTESGRTTYSHGTTTLRVYDVDTRAEIGEIRQGWYENDGDRPHASGFINDWWIALDDRAVIARIDGARVTLPLPP